jgi:hypothetical protein
MSLQSASSLRSILVLLLFSLFLTTCNTPPGKTPTIPPETSDTEDTQPVPQTQIPEITPDVVETPAPTRGVERVFFLVPAGADPDQVAAIQPVLEMLAAGGNLQVEQRTTLTSAELTPDVRIVVSLGPDPGLQDLAASAPRTQFAGLGIPGIKVSRNLSVIDSDGARPDRIGFVAGYLAAVITEEWRVGVIAISDTAEGVAARQGFINGAIFFCGLCKQIYPPYYIYPLYVEMPAATSPAEWQSAADILVNRAVKTVFIAPMAGGDDLLTYLAQAGVNLISSGTPPAGIRSQWVASIQPSYIPALKALWPKMMAGDDGSSVPISLEIGNVNPDLLSPGRQRLVETIISELADGYIDTGVDLNK